MPWKHLIKFLQYIIELRRTRMMKYMTGMYKVTMAIDSMLFLCPQTSHRNVYNVWKCHRQTNNSFNGPKRGLDWFYFLLTCLHMSTTIHDHKRRTLTCFEEIDVLEYKIAQKIHHARMTGVKGICLTAQCKLMVSGDIWTSEEGDTSKKEDGGIFFGWYSDGLMYNWTRSTLSILSHLLDLGYW